ncbi:MAG: hypothetical protein WAQ08_02235 [Aquabacterium sp.]|uniref:hypothetical protein n=1 Tax=Aquabacterium sp. TaxID=1872578 RepID=UPI003BB13DCD
MPLYDILVPTRKQWQDKRDAAKVPKGAAKVSIGDSIDPVHKSFSIKTAAKNVQDTEKLLNNLETYKKAVEKKYPKFVADIDKIMKGTRAHKKTMEDVAKAEAGYLKQVRNTEAIFIFGKNNKWPEKVIKELAGQFTKTKGFLDALGLLDDAWAKRAKEASGWMNKLENLKTAPSDDDVKKMQVFIDSCTQ